MLRKFTTLIAALLLLMYMGAAASATAKVAVVNTMDVIVDDAAVMAAGYEIEGYTYFKLRDIAYVMQNKTCKFSAGFDAVTRSILLETGGAYKPDGLELQPLSYGKRPATLSDMPVFIDGKEMPLEAYVIDGYTYYKLRDLGAALGFAVDFDSASRLIVIATPGSQQQPKPEGGTKADGKLTILLDPGHGGTDPGASSPDGRINENHLNLEVAQYLKELLEAQGATVHMTRTDPGTYPSLRERAAMIDQLRQTLDFFLSIHHNAGGGTGTEVLVPSDKQDPSGYSKQMADLVLQEFSALGLKNRGKKDGSGMVVLKGASASGVPGILTEFCFLDSADLAYVQTAAGRRAEAEALYRAVMNFFAAHAY